MTQKKTNKKIQSKAAEPQNGENIPPTIVESSEGEVFAPTQETEPTAKPIKPSKRPYIPLVQEHLETGGLSKKELLELILSTFPEVSKGGAATFLTDLKNSKYCHFKSREVRQLENGKLIFADKVVSAEAEVLAAEVVAAIQETPPEQPA